MHRSTDKMLLKFPDFMAPPNAKKSDQPQRPRALHPSASFSKLNPPEPERLSRAQRASTIHHGKSSEAAVRSSSVRANTVSESPPDRFEKMHEEDGNDVTGSPEKLPPDFDEIPIELASLTDRYAGG